MISYSFYGWNNYFNAHLIDPAGIYVQSQQ